MFTRTIDSALPKQHMAKVYDPLTTQDALILVQLRTGHFGLNSHLARIRKADSTRCQCGAEEETVRHFLFQCLQSSEPRRVLQEALGERRGDLSFALGGWSGRGKTRTGKQVDGSKEKWKPHMTAIKAVIHFVKETERF